MNTVDPLGDPSLLKVVPPLKDKRSSPSERTVENVDEDTPLPHANTPLLTPQLPFDEVIVKLSAFPVVVKVARVCVDQVPKESNPPICDPDCKATMVALAGSVPPDVPVGEDEVVVDVGVLEPDLGGYLTVDPQVPADGADMGTKSPSTTEPLKLKYQ